MVVGLVASGSHRLLKCSSDRFAHCFGVSTRLPRFMPLEQYDFKVRMPSVNRMYSSREALVNS